MRNFVQPGDTITVPAPGILTSGQGVQIGALFGIASTDAEAGDDVALGVAGVYELPKTAVALAIGDEVEFVAGTGNVRALDTGSRVGVVVATATASAGIVAVRLG